MAFGWNQRGPLGYECAIQSIDHALLITVTYENDERDYLSTCTLCIENTFLDPSGIWLRSARPAWLWVCFSRHRLCLIDNSNLWEWFKRLFEYMHAVHWEYFIRSQCHLAEISAARPPSRLWLCISKHRSYLIENSNLQKWLKRPSKYMHTGYWEYFLRPLIAFEHLAEKLCCQVCWPRASIAEAVLILRLT